MKPTLYLAPGLLCDAQIWEHQAATLAATHEVRVPQFADHESIADMAASILGDAPARFAMAGHSMGARIALEVFRQAPGRIDRLALLDTGVHPQREGEAAQRQVLLDLAASEGMAALSARWLPGMVHPTRHGDARLMGDLHAMVRRATPASYARQVRALLGRPDASDVLRQVKCPLLIGVGAQDAWSPPSQHEAMLAAAPHALYRVFTDSGHMAPAEAPEAVTAALRLWLAARP